MAGKFDQPKVNLLAIGAYLLCNLALVRLGKREVLRLAFRSFAKLGWIGELPFSLVLTLPRDDGMLGRLQITAIGRSR